MCREFAGNAPGISPKAWSMGLRATGGRVDRAKPASRCPGKEVVEPGNPRRVRGQPVAPGAKEGVRAPEALLRFRTRAFQGNGVDGFVVIGEGERAGRAGVQHEFELGEVVVKVNGDLSAIRGLVTSLPRREHGFDEVRRPPGTRYGFEGCSRGPGDGGIGRGVDDDHGFPGEKPSLAPKDDPWRADPANRELPQRVSCRRTGLPPRTASLRSPRRPLRH